MFEIKNTIYKNIYNNINSIYKSKGTNRAFRNLIRCYGVDEGLININAYASNITYDYASQYNYQQRKAKGLGKHVNLSQAKSDYKNIASKQ